MQQKGRMPGPVSQARGGSLAMGAEDSATPRSVDQTERERLFAEMARESGTVVRTISSGADFATMVHRMSNGEQPLLSPGFVQQWPNLVKALGSDSIISSADPWRYADSAVGLVLGSWGVCETGSVLVDESLKADRVVSMLSRRVVHVVHRSRLLDSLQDVAPLIQEAAIKGSLLSLITGPSRTADIERSMTVGVQGPAELCVVLA